MTSPTRIPRLNLHDTVTTALRGMILDGVLVPGEKIAERGLCDRFGISRTPLREALKVLAAEGLVELLPRRGAIVAQITESDIRDLFPIMGALEGLAGTLACARVTPRDIQHLRTLHEQMIDSYERRDEHRYLRQNRRIHEAIFAMAANPALSELYQQVLTRIHSCRFILKKCDSDWAVAVAEHAAIMDALARRDGALLSRLMQDHITGTSARIALAALGGDEKQDAV
ncbi:transcriptional regulator, GntR family [Gluconacetobacter diazotrophicus PA1 5]|uniref:GntR family transcriptional regulator n=2 Tax=Gluconacetobacter diazotrophicus TaxID=33996 RepID=A0A7W4I3K3_GLUDI|nr:GntR family transcriptional regulator [Gluconacetobacter diazotrophicus]ACI51109.1 transcriptional regulator, GntR family [Gluconacetobacter diazotrophicus PA1 5]MBB2155178.1 GntR family transcriptional regulator [Gluconacetobacter diazotrophicus]TWB07616.1 DNA-binding GntR family transcriptional regulator [Gluconacetobacter diazotrophicus]CAP54625.1 putative transcriptional regulator, GntR family [Gluconacetobacter diazotrophicus PA1 5]